MTPLNHGKNMKLSTKLLVFSSLCLLTGCSVFDTRGSAEPASTAPTTIPTGGGYYKDDGPGDDIPTNLAEIPDAVPKVEPRHRGASKPYLVMGSAAPPPTR
jgi:rare lipoprotein A